ncbi:MAG: DUF4976 domain-containing protein, partial [bacterium]|nr:DUF4976 domain-containing protein [bacterium]
DPEMIAGGTRVKMRGYVDDVICDQAINTLERRPTDRPFCLLCWFKAPHRSWEPAKRYENEFARTTIPEPPTFALGLEDRPGAIRDSDLQIADMPDFFHMGVPRDASRAERKRLNYQHYVKQYYRVLLGVDHNIGRLLGYLDKAGLAEDTFVLHTSDNGFFMGEYGLFDKRMMYEPSIRVPMIARYPAGFEGGRTDDHNMVLNNDICHTILDYAGISRPASIRHHGQSWRPILEDGAATWRNSWLYEFFEYPAIACVGKIRGVRTPRWKLIHYIQQPEEFELFDLESDPEERHNLYNSPTHRAKRDELRTELDRLRTETAADRSEDGTPTRECTIRIADRPFR